MSLEPRRAFAKVALLTFAVAAALLVAGIWTGDGRWSQTSGVAAGVAAVCFLVSWIEWGDNRE